MQPEIRPDTFPALDGLRGLAVMLVVLSHMGNQGMDLLPWPSFAGYGKAGVFLFFVLSAYLLTRQALTDLAGESRVETLRYWSSYLVRRAFRIFPLYWIVLTTALVGYFAGFEFVRRLSPENWLQHMLMLRGESIFWTIPVEFSYYLVIPVLATVCVAIARFNRWLPSAFTALCLVAAAIIWPEQASALNGIVLWPYLVIFLSGSLAACVGVAMASAPKRAPPGQSAVRLLWWLVLIALLLIVFATIPDAWRTITGSDITNRHFHRDYLFYGVFWTSILFVIMQTGVGHAVFASPPARFLGRTSFSIYLTHLPVLALWSQVDLPATLVAAGALLTVAAFAWLTWRWIEVPGINLGKVISKRILKREEIHARTFS